MSTPTVLVVDMPEGQGFGITTDSLGSIEVKTAPASTGPVPVSSVFGRTGAVVAAAGDYDASEVTNTSGVAGATVADALDTLNAGGGGAVASVFGRTGAVVAASGDYDSDQVDNASGVPGASCSDALDNLSSAITSLDSSDVANASAVPGANVSNALNSLAGTIAAGVLSVFGRVGAVVAANGDYNSTQVTNSSGVAGATVTAALNTLAGLIASLTTGVSSGFGRAGAVLAANGDYNSTQVTNSSSVAGATVTAALNTLATFETSLQIWNLGNCPGGITLRYLLTNTGGQASVTVAQQGQRVFGRAGTMTRIRYKQGIAMVTDSLTYTLQVNGVDTACTWTVLAGQTPNIDITTGMPINFATGDNVGIKISQSGGTDTAANRAINVDLCGYFT